MLTISEKFYICQLSLIFYLIWLHIRYQLKGDTMDLSTSVYRQADFDKFIWGANISSPEISFRCDPLPVFLRVLFATLFLLITTALTIAPCKS